MTKRFDRVVAVIDERLPYDEFMRVTREQAGTWPVEIVENGVMYRAVDGRNVIKGHKISFVATYEEVQHD